MRRKLLIPVLCLGFVVVICFLVLRSIKPDITTIPATSLEESIYERVITQTGDCKRILLFDRNSNLVFAESSSGITPVLTNKEFTKFKKLIPMMNLQEFSEEKMERGPIDWRAENNIEKGSSIIYGFAENDAKTIVINSEGNIQPNRFFIRDNLWVWYVTIPKDKVKLPVEVSVYNADGQIIYGGNNKEE